MEEKTYSIGDVSKMFDLPVSTLRFYDKEGLFPDLDRNPSGIRKFNAKTIEAIRVIECLKKSGMELKDIKEFMKWCSKGSATYELRKNMFLKQKEAVESELAKLQKVLDMINFKCWYYDESIRANNEDWIKNKPLEEFPTDIQKAYLNTHS